MFDIKLEIEYQLPHMQKAGGESTLSGSADQQHKESCMMCCFKDVILLHNVDVICEIQKAGFTSAELVQKACSKEDDCSVQDANKTRESCEYSKSRSYTQAAMCMKELLNMHRFLREYCIPKMMLPHHAYNVYSAAISNSIFYMQKPSHDTQEQIAQRPPSGVEQFKHFVAYMLHYSYSTSTLCLFTSQDTKCGVEHGMSQSDIEWSMCLVHPDQFTREQKAKLSTYEYYNLLPNLFKVCRRVCNLNFQTNNLYGPVSLGLKTFIRNNTHKPAISLAYVAPHAYTRAVRAIDDSMVAIVSMPYSTKLEARTVNTTFNRAIYLPDDITMATYIRFCDSVGIVRMLLQRLKNLNGQVFLKPAVGCEETQRMTQCPENVVARKEDVLLQATKLRHTVLHFMKCKLVINYDNGLFNARYADNDMYQYSGANDALQDLIDIYRNAHWMGVNIFHNNIPSVFTRVVARFSGEQEFQLQCAMESDGTVLSQSVAQEIESLLQYGASHVAHADEGLINMYKHSLNAAIKNKYCMFRENLRLAFSMTHASAHKYAEFALKHQSSIRRYASIALLHVGDHECAQCAQLYNCLNNNDVGVDKALALRIYADNMQYNVSLLNMIGIGDNTVTFEMCFIKQKSQFILGRHTLVHDMLCAQILQEVNDIYKACKCNNGTMRVRHKADTRYLDTLYADINNGMNLQHMGLIRVCADSMLRLASYGSAYAKFTYSLDSNAINMAYNESSPHRKHDDRLVDVNAIAAQNALLYYSSRSPDEHMKYACHNIAEDLTFCDTLHIASDGIVLVRPLSAGSVQTFNLYRELSLLPSSAIETILEFLANAQDMLPPLVILRHIKEIEDIIDSDQQLLQIKLRQIEDIYNFLTQSYSLLREEHKRSTIPLPQVLCMPNIRQKLQNNPESISYEALHNYCNFMSTYSLLCILHTDVSRMHVVFKEACSMFATMCPIFIDQLRKCAPQNVDAINPMYMRTYLLCQDIMCMLYAQTVSVYVSQNANDFLLVIEGYKSAMRAT